MLNCTIIILYASNCQLYYTSIIFASLVCGFHTINREARESALPYSTYKCIFHGSKFSQIAVFDNFIEKILQIRCRSRCRWCKVSTFLLKYFREGHRIRENRKILDPRNISAIRSSVSLLKM